MTLPGSAPDALSAASSQHGARPPLVLESPLGVGRTSRVWRARLVEDWGAFPAGTRFAVKILREDLAEDEDVLVTLRSEIDASRAVHHPGLARTRFGDFSGPTPPLADEVDVEALGEAAADAEAARPWLLLDLVPGTALDEALTEEGVFAEPAVRAIGLRLAQAIAAMHAAGWVHGDVKPDNIRLDDQGRAVLIDLGFARRAGAPDAPLGTPTYLAPERASGGPPAASADLFALGCVLFEISVGTPAAGDPPDLGTLRSGGVRPPSELVPRVTPLLDALILELLAPSPAARPTATEVAGVLQEGEASPWWRSRLRGGPEISRPTVAWSGRDFLPMVGRDRELGVLDTAWREARSAGAAVVITGERGTGKSRLVSEFAHRVRREEDEAPVYLYGRCDAVSDERPGAPLIALLRRWLHLPPEVRPGPRSRKLIEDALSPEVARTLLGILEPDAESNETAEVSEAVALGEWLLSLGGESPTIVFLDDVNFAGTATLTALRRVARDLEDSRLLLVLGLRQRAPVQHIAALSELRGRLSGRTHRIDLGPLGEDAVLRLVEHLFHHSAPRLRLARTLFERTGGLPGSIGELLRLAADRGWTRPAPAPGRGIELLIPPDDLPRPESMRVTVTERLRSLPGKTRIWLERLAVVGARIDPALVARAWPRSRATERDAAFARLVRAGWLVAAGSRYRFAEPVEREETLAQTGAERLKRTHAAVARAITAVEDGAHQVPSYRRAYHLREAGAHASLLSILPAVLDQLRIAGHPHRRATVAGWGLQALDETEASSKSSSRSSDESGSHAHSATLRRPFLEVLADAADRLGEREDQRVALEALGALEIDIDTEAAAAAHVYLLHARYAVASGQLGLARGFLRNAHDLADRAHERIGSEIDTGRLASDRAEIERMFGHIANDLGDYGQASEHAERALALAPDAVARALSRLVDAEVQIHVGRVGAALRRLATARRELRQVGSGLDARAAQAEASLLGGRAWRMVGRPFRAASAFERATVLALRAGEGRIEVEVAARRGRLLADVGREREAELALRDALFAARRIEDRRSEALASLFLGTLLAEEGVVGADDLVRRARALSQEMGLVRMMALTLAIEARLARQRGEADEAERSSERAWKLVEQHGAELPDRVVIGGTRALILEELGDHIGSQHIVRSLERRIDTDNGRLRSQLLARRQRRWVTAVLATALSPDGPLYPRVVLAEWPS